MGNAVILEDKFPNEDEVDDKWRPQKQVEITPTPEPLQDLAQQVETKKRKREYETETQGALKKRKLDYLIIPKNQLLYKGVPDDVSDEFKDAIQGKPQWFGNLPVAAHYAFAWTTNWNAQNGKC